MSATVSATVSATTALARLEPEVRAAAAATFRARAWANGYRPLAVSNPGYAPHGRHAGKRPLGEAWQDRARRDAPEAATAAVDPCALNTGILCDGLRAVDIDLEDIDLAADVALWIVDRVGVAPTRYRRNSAKVLILCRAVDGAAPGKRTLAGKRDGGDPPRIEVLGLGQQFVADGIHPSGAALSWRDGSPATVPLADLPALSEADITALFAAFASALGAVGETERVRIDLPTLPPGTAPDARAAAVLETCLAAFNTTTQSRHDTMLAAAMRLAPFVKAGLLDGADVCGDLEAAMGRELSEPDEVRRALAGALPKVQPFEPATGGAEFSVLPAPGADGDPPILDRAAPLRSARELVQRSYTVDGARVLHHQFGTFYRWTGTHYREASGEEVRSAAYAFLERAAHAGKDAVERFNPTRARVADVMDALAAIAQVPGGIAAPAWFAGTADDPPARELLACGNGLLHLPTRRLLPGTPRFFAMNALDYHYDAEAPAPARWHAFLRTIWPDDPQSIGTLQELFGLLLAGDTRHQKIFLVVGPKRSGKGTIARIMAAMLGRENVANPTLAGLGQNFGLAPLIGKPLALISDARLGGRADAHVIAERLLSISGEDSLTIDRKFRDAWTGTLQTRFVIMANELPRLTDASGALAGRFIVLQMTESFYGREDQGLTGKLLAELPGILNWALAGLDRLAARGHFEQPDSARQAIEEMEDLASPIGAFLKSRCVVGPEHSAGCDSLFDAWVEWCRGQNRDAIGTKTTFGRDLRAAIPALDMRRTRDGAERQRVYQGVQLLPPDNSENRAGIFLADPTAIVTEVRGGPRT